MIGLERRAWLGSAQLAAQDSTAQPARSSAVDSLCAIQARSVRTLIFQSLRTERESTRQAPFESRVHGHVCQSMPRSLHPSCRRRSIRPTQPPASDCGGAPVAGSIRARLSLPLCAQPSAAPERERVSMLARACSRAQVPVVPVCPRWPRRGLHARGVSCLRSCAGGTGSALRTRVDRVVFGRCRSVAGSVRTNQELARGIIKSHALRALPRAGCRSLLQRTPLCAASCARPRGHALCHPRLLAARTEQAS